MSRICRMVEVVNGDQKLHRCIAGQPVVAQMATQALIAARIKMVAWIAHAHLPAYARMLLLPISMCSLMDMSVISVHMILSHMATTVKVRSTAGCSAF